MSFTTMKSGSQVGRFQHIRRPKFYIPAAIITIVLIIVIPIAVVFGLRNSGGDDSIDNSQQPSSNTTITATPRPTLWKPTLNTPWQIVLLNPVSSTSISPSVPVYDLDLFTNPTSTFQALQARGIKVICYFSGGTYEPNRPDSSQFRRVDQGNTLDGWPDEKWLNLASASVRSIMKHRIALAASKGCDAIDPDNVDGYANKNGLGLTEQQSVDFMKYISNEARALNMSVGLKNALSIIPSLLSTVDFAVNEQCVQYNECDKYKSMVDGGLPVFHIEYPNEDRSVSSDASKVSKYCSDATLGTGSTVLKGLKLDGFVQYCNSTTATTSTS